jgi:hypothetical protein
MAGENGAGMTGSTAELGPDLSAVVAFLVATGVPLPEMACAPLADEVLQAVEGACLLVAEMEARVRTDDDRVMVVEKTQSLKEAVVGLRVPQSGVAQCKARKRTGLLCRSTLGQLGRPVCGKHAGLFVVPRMVAHLEVKRCGFSPQPDARLTTRQTTGKCAICPETLKPKEAKICCACCGFAAHSSCVVDQLDGGDWGPVKDRESMEMLCVGCVVERQDEVELLKRYFLGDGAGGFAIFEPDEGAYLRESSRALWEVRGRLAARQWALVRPVTVSTSPWKAVALVDVPESAGLEALAELDRLASLGLPMQEGAARLAVSAQQAGAAQQAAAARVVGAAQGEGAGRRGQQQESASLLAIRDAFAALTAKVEDLSAQQFHPARDAPQVPRVLALFDAPGGLGGSGVDVTGAVDGYKLGAEGAPNTPSFYTDLDWIGMRPVTAQDKARMQRYVGADRVDLFVRFRDCAEAQGVQQSFMLGEMEVQATRSRKSTPVMAICPGVLGQAAWGDRAAPRQ